jgi:drug/metabolite transporter (DMT)-like permease
MSEPSKTNTRGLSKEGLLHLLVVYIVWGSTYLAIRVAVRDGSGFTPFVVGMVRVLIAGGVLLLVGKLTGKRLQLTGKELATLVALGLLFWLGGNGLVMVGEQRADSGTAALIIAGVPVWAAVIQSVIDRRLPSALLIGSLLLGVTGIAVLSWPVLQTGLRADVLSVVALVIGSISWAGGTVLQGRARLQLPAEISSGYQMLFGGIFFALAALVTGEPIPHPVLDATLAVIYLIVFGSLLGFTSFIQALNLLPTKIVTTYGYVNPIIAVFLGWLILQEKLSYWTIFGALLVLLSVTGVFRDHAHDNAREREEAERLAVESKQP